MVDDAGFDEAAHLEQMMPVPTIADEPGGIEAQNCTDLAGAQPSHQTIKAGTSDRSARRPAEIIVDHLNVDEAALSSDIDKIVLP